MLGAGAFGKVVLASSYLGPRAIKAIEKAHIGEKLDIIKKEISCLKVLDHPNIVRFYEYYENDYYLYMVMEFCQGKSLLQVIEETGMSGEKLFTED